MLLHFTPEKTSPLIFITIAVSAAIYVQHTFLFSSYFLHTTLLASFVLLAYKQNFIIPLYKNIFFLFTLFCFTLCITHYQQTNHAAIHAQLTEKKISIKGTVTDIQTHNHTRLPVYIRIQTTEYKKNKRDWLPLESSIVIYAKEAGNLQVGDSICVENIESNHAQGSFKEYLMYQNIAAYFFCPYFHYTLLERPDYSLSRKIHAIKNNLMSSLEKKLSPESFCLFSTLFLGKKMRHTNPETDFPDIFRQWGISHLLARSGAHLALFIYLYFLLIMYIPLPFRIKQFLCALLTGIYFLLSFSSTSFLRAFVTALLFFYCTLVGRPAQSLHITLLVCTAFLLLNPISLFFLDFQLSFLFTISLCWLARQIYTSNKNID